MIRTTSLDPRSHLIREVIIEAPNSLNCYLCRGIDSRGRGLETQAISTISHGPSSIIAATMDAA